MIGSGIILKDVKKVLGLAEDYDAFDVDISFHINAAFTQLHQMGVGPDDGFFLSEGDETWDDFLSGLVDQPYIQNIKTYVSMYTRLLFDPPTTSFAIEAIKNVLRETEWRLNLQVESTSALKGASTDG